MSAYVVSKEHVDVLVRFALHGTGREPFRWWAVDSYGVNVWTKAGSCRCITMSEHGMGVVDGVDSPGYWTMRGEGSSNEGRDTWVQAHKIVRAVGTIVGERDPRFATAA